MKTNSLKLFALLIAVTAGTACSKNDTKKSNSELITQGTWKFASAGLDSDKNGTVDMEDGSIEPCEKDNIATFTIGGTGSYDEGATKCDISAPQTKAFTWQFKNAEKELEFDGDTFTILSINDSQLKVYFDSDLGGGNIVRYLLILTH